MKRLLLIASLALGACTAQQIDRADAVVDTGCTLASVLVGNPGVDAICAAAGSGLEAGAFFASAPVPIDPDDRRDLFNACAATATADGRATVEWQRICPGILTPEKEGVAKAFTIATEWGGTILPDSPLPVLAFFDGTTASPCGDVRAIVYCILDGDGGTVFVEMAQLDAYPGRRNVVHLYLIAHEVCHWITGERHIEDFRTYGSLVGAQKVELGAEECVGVFLHDLGIPPEEYIALALAIGGAADTAHGTGEARAARIAHGHRKGRIE